MSFQPESTPHTRNVEIDDVDVSMYNAIERVDISLRQNEHDHAVVVLAGISPLSVTEYVDRAIMIRIRMNDGSGFTFAGFINHIRPSHKVRSGRVEGGLLQEATLHCLGASSTMRGRKARVWTTFTVKDMVEEMSIDYKFSYSCPDTAPTIPSMSQRGLSDWQALVKACRMSGLAVNVHGTEIHVWNPLNALRHGAPSGVLQTVDSSSGTEFAPGKIIEFNGSFGSSSPYGDVNNESIELLDEHGKLLTASTSDLLNTAPASGTAVTSSVADMLAVEAVSLSDARRKLAANRAYAGAYVAEATTTGVAGPVPGSAIGVDGFKSDFDGLWLLRGIDMRTNRGHFLTDWELSRSTSGSTTPRQVELETYDPAPQPLLRSGAWRSSSRRANVYSSN